MDPPGGNVPPVGGYHAGPFVTSWFDMPADDQVKVHFTSNSVNLCPDGSGGLVQSTPEQPYTGTVVSGFDYQRYETGATPVWVSMGQPGQYYDAETDLYQGGARMYDATEGRYLAPEPLWRTPVPGIALALGSWQWPPFGYGAGDPVNLVDRSGLMVSPYLDDGAGHTWYPPYPEAQWQAILDEPLFAGPRGPYEIGIIIPPPFLDAVGLELLEVGGEDAVSSCAGNAMRVAPDSLQEQLTLDEARSGAGRRIMKDEIQDPEYPKDRWQKMEHTHTSPETGDKTVIHYWEEIKTALRHGFKFK